MSNRIKWIDAAKGILIFLVILGHATAVSAVNIIIFSFHMAAFFILSGYTFSNKILPWNEFFKKQCKGIIFPYLILSSILLFYFFLKSRFLNSGEFQIASGIISVFVPVSGRVSTSVYGLWFLPCIFIAKTVFFTMLKIYRKSKWLSISVLFFVCILAYAVSKITGNISVLTIAPFAIIFMMIGRFLKEKNFALKNWTTIFLTLVIYIISMALNIVIFEKSIDLSSFNIGNPLLFIIHCTSGSILLFSVAMLLENSSFFSKIGAKSLYYYGLHYEVLGFFNAIVFKGDNIIFALLNTIFTILILYVFFAILDNVVLKRGKQ